MKNLHPSFWVGVCVTGSVIMAMSNAGAAPDVFSTGTQAEIATAKRVSVEALHEKVHQRTVGNVAEYRVHKVDVDKLKMAHTRMSQTINRVQVWEGESIVHLKRDGLFRGVTCYPNEEIKVETKPKIPSGQAIEIPKYLYSESEYLTPEPSSGYTALRIATTSRKARHDI